MLGSSNRNPGVSGVLWGGGGVDDASVEARGDCTAGVRGSGKT